MRVRHFLLFTFFTVCCIVLPNCYEAFPNPAVDQDAGDDLKDNGIVTTFFGNLTNSAQIPQHVMKESLNVANKVKEYVQEAEREINYIYGQLAAITDGQANLTKNFIHEFNDVKTGLRKARQELRKLARETVTLTQDVKDMLDHEDDINIIEVEVALSSLKELLKRTKVRLEEAKIQYNNAIGKMGTIGTTMKEKIVTLKELNNEKSDAFVKYATEVRAGVYAGCATVTVGCIVCDALVVCLGLCSAVATSTCWATSIPSVEASLAKYQTAVATFTNRVEEITENIHGLQDTVNIVVQGLEHELDILIKWESVSGTLDSKLEQKNFQAKVLSEAKRVRKSLVRHVNDLQLVAEEYLALPPSLFGEIAAVG